MLCSYFKAASPGGIIRNSPILGNNYSTAVGISSPMLSVVIRAAFETDSSSHFPFVFVARKQLRVVFQLWSLFFACNTKRDVYGGRECLRLVEVGMLLVIEEDVRA